MLGSGECHGGQPVAEDHVVPQPLQQSLKEVVVGIDEAGEHDLALAVHYLFAVLAALAELRAVPQRGNPPVLHRHRAVPENPAPGIHGDQYCVFQ